MIDEDKKWLNELFEFEFCELCGGDEHDHTVVHVNGSKFALCGKWEEEDDE